jgi:hypothetical protein
LEESGSPIMAPDLRRGSGMRIGTWNLAGRWSARHLAMLTAADCDVWLLTEVNDRLAIADYTGHVTETPMRPKVSWAGIFSRTPLEPLADPNPASAMVRIGDTTFVCSILPWRGTGAVARRQPRRQDPPRPRHPPGGHARRRFVLGRRLEPRTLGPRVRRQQVRPRGSRLDRRLPGPGCGNRGSSTRLGRAPQHRPHRRPEDLAG